MMILDDKRTEAADSNRSNSSSQAGKVSETEWQRLCLILGGHIFFQTLAAAVRFDLFALLKEHKSLTREEIAARLNIDEKPARILLLGCTALELIVKSGDRYSNSNLADHYLVRTAPSNIVDVVQWQHLINYQPMYYFGDSIAANENVGLNVFDGGEKTLYERLTHNPPLENVFQKAMAAISVQANSLLAEFVDFSDIEHLVDVGGGNGANIIALARIYPHLKATVFDSPSVCQIARENIEKAGLSDRLDAAAGDCFEDPFPAGCDCILFGHFFTIWSEERNRQLLAKCHQSLPPSGKAMIFNMMQSDDETGPLTAALGSPYFLTLATGEGMLYTWQEYETWMRQAGFSLVESQRLPRDHGVITGVKG